MLAELVSSRGFPKEFQLNLIERHGSCDHSSYINILQLWLQCWVHYSKWVGDEGGRPGVRKKKKKTVDNGGKLDPRSHVEGREGLGWMYVSPVTWWLSDLRDSLNCLSGWNIQNKNGNLLPIWRVIRSKFFHLPFCHLMGHLCLIHSPGKKQEPQGQPQRERVIV